MKFHNQQAGVGLQEVLIALLVLSVSLLAIASLQTRSLQFNQSAYWRSQANILAYDVLDRVRAQSDNRAAVVAEWQDEVASKIPGGEGEVACAEALDPEILMCTATLRWVEVSIFGEVDAGNLDAEARTTFTYTTAI